jgi:hypothetical protein
MAVSSSSSCKPASAAGEFAATSFITKALQSSPSAISSKPLIASSTGSGKCAFGSRIIGWRGFEVKRAAARLALTKNRERKPLDLSMGMNFGYKNASIELDNRKVLNQGAMTFATQPTRFCS